jgi:hypothetical protein
MSDNGIKYIDIAEFRRLGFVQELNRRFLHPLGLALEVVLNEDGTETLGGVWDYREDPEGIYYADLPEEAQIKAYAMDELWLQRYRARTAALGWMVQPPESLIQSLDLVAGDNDVN